MRNNFKILSLFCACFIFVASFILMIGYYTVALPDLNIEEAIAEQSHSDILFNLDKDVAHYKMSLIEANNPKVIAIGSSRSMQFREIFFKDKFINSGYVVSSLSELESFMNNIENLKA